MRLVLVFLFVAGVAGFGQTVGCGLAHPGACLNDVVRDQGRVWTSPAHLKRADLKWVLPLAGATALGFHFDTRAENALGNNATLTDHSQKIAWFGSPVVTASTGAGLYLMGLGLRKPHLAETGRLSAEAVVDVSLVVGALKLATDRQRLNSGQAGFWLGGANSFKANSSFPSGHAAASWAIASAIAHEYPHNKPVKIAAYAFASAISVVRITGHAHFPSDVVVGSAFGYLMGRFVVRRHASSELH